MILYSAFSVLDRPTIVAEGKVYRSPSATLEIVRFYVKHDIGSKVGFSLNLFMGLDTYTLRISAHVLYYDVIYRIYRNFNAFC